MTLQKRLVSVGGYRLTGKKLGKGNFAKVEEALHSVLNMKVAIKIMDVTQIKENYIIRNLHREARIMSQLRHPCIAALFQTIQNGNMYYLVTELIGGGDLCTFIKAQKYGKLDERNTRVYARQLISALAHMHAMGIIHRDLKMENVMMNSIRTQIKIVDFGLSNMYDPNSPLRTHCGSPEYAAPELFVPGKSYGPEVDLWSLGVILYGMVVGQLPFVTARDDALSFQERRKRLLVQINKGYSLAQRKALAAVSVEFRSMVARMLVSDAAKRISVTELVFHSWVTDKGRKMIVQNPLKALDEEWQISIMKQVGALINLEWTTVRYALNNEPQGDVAGMYNILAYRVHAQQLDGDGVTKNFPTGKLRNCLAGSTPRSHTSIPAKSPELPATAKSARVKPPTTPRSAGAAKVAEKPRVVAANSNSPKPPATLQEPKEQQNHQRVLLSTDVKNRLQLSAEIKPHTMLDWGYDQCRQIPPPAEGSNETRPIVVPKSPAAAQPRPPPKPRSHQRTVPKAASPRAANPVGNEVQALVGPKTIAKILLAKKNALKARISPKAVAEKEKRPATTASPKSHRTYAVAEATSANIKSKSEPTANKRRLSTAPAAIFAAPIARALKRNRIVAVTGSPSAPGKAVSAPPAVPQVRRRRVTMAKIAPNVVEHSPYVQGDTKKRASSTPAAKHMQIQRNVLSDPIARSIAGYIVNNMAAKVEGASKWKKNVQSTPAP